MKNKKEVLILGGGLAGLTSAIHLSKLGLQVTVIEKNGYPKHKVCGEYISNEVLPYFDYLDIQLSDLKPSTITKLQFSTTDGTSINTKLPPRETAANSVEPKLPTIMLSTIEIRVCPNIPKITG